MTVKRYFIRKDTPKKHDYRFNYARTPESALMYRVGEYCLENRQNNMSGCIKQVKTFYPIKAFKTREEAEAYANKLNKEIA